MIDQLPAQQFEYLSGLELALECCDYMFVRTGAQPEVPLAEKKQEVHIWINDQFLVSTKDFQRMVLHGNSIGATP